MNIVLSGFMGTGKSAVGRRLAERLSIPFFDVDEAIARQSGHSIAEIFATDGEAAFRKRETEVIEGLAARDRAVIATGGGALLAPRNREALRRNGILVCLSARVGTLLERLKDDMGRPLLGTENREKRVEQLLKDRKAVYAECEIQVSTDGKTIAEVTEEIVRKISPRWKA